MNSLTTSNPLGRTWLNVLRRKRLPQPPTRTGLAGRALVGRALVGRALVGRALAGLALPMSEAFVGPALPMSQAFVGRAHKLKALPERKPDPEVQMPWVTGCGRLAAPSVACPGAQDHVQLR